MSGSHVFQSSLSVISALHCKKWARKYRALLIVSSFILVVDLNTKSSCSRRDETHRRTPRIFFIVVTSFAWLTCHHGPHLPGSEQLIPMRSSSLAMNGHPLRPRRVFHLRVRPFGNALRGENTVARGEFYPRRRWKGGLEF